MKKTVTTMLVVATVFLCSFNVYASSVDPSPMVYSTDTKSYLDGDLQVFTIAEIDNAVMTEYGAHTTSNILQGTTHDFYYDADYVWDAPMQVSVNVRNNTNKYIVIPSGALYNNWNMTYTDYSNNGSGTQGSELYLGYYIEDNLGVVYQTTSSPSVILKSDDMFYADDIIIEPGQNKTYQYTVHFCFKGWTHNNANIYDPFDCSINVTCSSVLSGINDAYETTISDFINADDIPYSVIAYLNALVSQGVEDQEYYQQIIDRYYYLNHYANRTTILTTYSPTMYSVDGNVGAINATIYRPYEINVDLEALGVGGNNQYLYDYILDFPVYYNVRFSNGTDNTYLMNRNYYQIPKVRLNNNTSYSVIGETIDVINQNGCYPYSVWANFVNINFDELYQNRALMMGRSNYHCEFIVHYYIGVSGINLSNFSFSTSNITFDQSNFYQPTFTLQNYSFFGSLAKNFADIRDLLIGDKQNNDDISDQVADNQAQEDVIHAQEEQWYQDNEDAITAVGLSNYQFSGNQTAGLSGVTSQFTAVWNALDGWTNIYIFVLTLSLAAFILRHNPFTRRQQNYSDRPKGEST